MMPVVRVVRTPRAQTIETVVTRASLSGQGTQSAESLRSVPFRHVTLLRLLQRWERGLVSLSIVFLRHV